MKKNIYVVYDSKAGYGAPLLDDNDDMAIRSFAYHCKEEGSLFNRFPEDYNLFYLGTYDTKSAFFELIEAPLRIASALEFI